MKCPNCGNEILEDAKFCGKCGTPVVEIKTTAEVATEAKEAIKEDEVELVLEKNTDMEMAKVESSLDNEEDLQEVLTATQTTGVQTQGNAQAQTIVHQETTPVLEVPPTKTEELIAQKQKEKAERDARLAEREKQLQEEMKGKETIKPKTQMQSNIKGTAQPGDKWKGILSVISLLGWIIAFLTSMDNRSEFLTKHMNRTFLIVIMALLYRLPLIGNILSLVAVIAGIIEIYNIVTENDIEIPGIDSIKILK